MIFDFDFLLHGNECTIIHVYKTIFVSHYRLEQELYKTTCVVNLVHVHRRPRLARYLQAVFTVTNLLKDLIKLVNL